MVAAAIGDEVLWVRMPWAADAIVDAGSSVTTITREYQYYTTDFNPSVDLASEGPWSIAWWCIRRGSTAVARYLFGVTGAPRLYLGFGIGGNNVLAVGIDGGVNYTSATLAVDTVAHFAVTFDGTTGLKIYRDGSLAQTIVNSVGGTLPNANVAIGYQSGGLVSDGWLGAIEDFRIFDRVLTAGECATLAASPPESGGSTARPSHPMKSQVIG